MQQSQKMWQQNTHEKDLLGRENVRVRPQFTTNLDLTLIIKHFTILKLHTLLSKYDLQRKEEYIINSRIPHDLQLLINKPVERNRVHYL